MYAGQRYKVHPQAGKLPAKKHDFEQYPAANNRQQKEQRFAVSAARGELDIDSQQQQQQIGQQQQQNPQELANMIAAAMAQLNHGSLALDGRLVRKISKRHFFQDIKKSFHGVIQMDPKPHQIFF